MKKQLLFFSFFYKPVIKLVAVFFLLHALSTKSSAQVWTTAKDGPWSDKATWTSNTVPPTTGDLGTVNIGHAVTLDQNATATTLNINAGTLTTTGSYTLTVSDKATIFNGATFTNSASIASNIFISNFVVSNGGTYNHNATGSIPNGASTDFPGSASRSFGATSSVVITKWANGGSAPAALPATGNPGWGNLTINVASLAGSYWKQYGAITNIQGNFNIKATGPSRELRLYEVVTGSVNTLPDLTISGNLTLDGGKLSLLGGSTSQSASTLKVYLNGDVILNNGTLNLSGSNGFTSCCGFLPFYQNYCYVYCKGDLAIYSPAVLTQPKDGSVVVGFLFVKPGGTQNITSYNGGVNFAYIGFGIGQMTPTATLTMTTVVLNSSFDMTNITTLANIFRVFDKATLSVTGEYKISGNTTFTLYAGGTLKIGSKDGITSVGNNAGNIQTSNGRNYNSAAHFVYAGAYNQVTGNGLPANISGSLTAANSGAIGDNKVTLSAPITVTGKLSLQDGLLSTGTNLLTLSSTGTLDALAGGSDNSFVNGPMARGTNALTEYVFPVGKAGSPDNWRPLSVKPASTSANVFLAEYFTGPTPNNTVLLSNMSSLENNEYWKVNRTGGTTAAVIKLNYENPGTGINNWTPIDPCADCEVGVAQYNTSGSGYWDFTKNAANFDPGIPETRPYTSNGNLYSASISSFSLSRPFTAAVNYSIILPVKLLSFSGHLVFVDGRLEWEIVDASDLAGFELEYSRDSRNFSKLADLPATNRNLYHYLDRNLTAGMHFYRLLVKENNGKRFYSKTVMLSVGKTFTKILGPQQNPVKDRLTLLILSAKDQKVEAIISDAAGRQLSMQQSQLIAGQNQWYISTQKFQARGLYFITVTTADGEKQTFKFLKE